MKIATYCLQINRKLLPVKVHYFIFMTALGSAHAFRAIFTKHMGLTATELGLIFFLAPFLRIITNPFFGFISDYFQKFRLIICLNLIIVGLCYICFTFIPPKMPMSRQIINISDDNFRTEAKYSCQQNDSFPAICDFSLVLYNEYRVAAEHETERANFACDVQCSDLISEDKNAMHCSLHVQSKFKILVDVSICDIAVKLHEVELRIFNISVSNAVFTPGNANFRRKTNFQQGISKDCFVEQINGTIKNKSDEFFFEEYPSVSSTDHNNSTKMYVLQYFLIQSQANILSIDSDNCSSNYKCKIEKCFSRTRDELNVGKFDEEGHSFVSLQFWSIFILYCIYCATFGAIIALMVAVSYELLGGKIEQYGHQRLFGTIGGGIGALLVGYLNRISATDSADSDYKLGFYFSAFLMLIDIIPVYQIKITHFKRSPDIRKDVSFLFTKVDILYNLFVVCIIGALSGFIWNFQFSLMQEMDSSQVLLDLSIIFECLFEIPCFVMSGWIIQKIGHDHCNNIILLCFGLRYLSFTFMYNPWWCLTAAILHGPASGLFYSSMTMYAKIISPSGTEATVQSLLHLCFEGIGLAAGSVLGGVGIDKLGTRMSFMYATKLSFLLLFVNILMGIIFPKRTLEVNEEKEYATVER